MKPARSLIAAAFVSAIFTACSSPQAPASGDASATEVARIPVTVDAESGSVTFQSEIADNDPERMRGLMFRKVMGDREGMIFLFPREQQLSFYMRNTLIPLDMIFIRADHTILGIVENAVPQTETSRSVPGDSQFVLEVNGGTAAALGIKPGQNVSFYAPIPPN